MGKIQSKQRVYRKRDEPEGEFVLNAHFNPLALSEYEESLPKPSSELSFRISGSHKDVIRAGFAEDKYPLKVVLPPEGSEENFSVWEEKDSCSSKDETSKDETLTLNCSTKTNDDQDEVRRVEGEKEEEEEEKTHLSLEEFECDVSVKTEAGMEKQEFLFTLYDFDGHGKITKDDIAGLVRSIYDAVGTSIKLPPSGSKTIKVRLTVSPEQQQKQKLQQQIQQQQQQQQKPGGTTSTSNTNSPAMGNNRHSSLISPASLAEAIAKGSPRRSTRKNRPVTVCRQNLIEMIHASMMEKTHTKLKGCDGSHICEELLTKHRHRHRHANNRDNVIECRDRRNHYLDLAGIENYNSKFSSSSNNNNNISSNNDNSLLSSSSPNGCPYNLDGTHVCSKSAKSHANMRTRKAAGHHRSRSHDLTSENLLGFRYQLLDKEQAKQLALVDLLSTGQSNNNNDKSCYKWTTSTNHVRSKSYDAHENPHPHSHHHHHHHHALLCSPKVNVRGLQRKSLQPQQQPFVSANGHSSSPHHHKHHRNREREHQRAMQQVANWIEREHGMVKNISSGNGGSDDKAATTTTTTPPPPPRGGNNNAKLSSTSSPLVVEKHEHHHVHEHVHHHYHHHHYNEV